jgi:hypothetical protein
MGTSETLGSCLAVAALWVEHWKRSQPLNGRQGNLAACGHLFELKIASKPLCVKIWRISHELDQNRQADRQLAGGEYHSCPYLARPTFDDKWMRTGSCT